ELDPKWLVIIGDAASEKTLRDAGVHQALGLVAATTTDATNIYIVLTARSRTFEMIIEEIRVTQGSALAHATVGSSGIHHQFGIMILAIRRADGETRFNPVAQDTLRAGDYLIAMGEPAQLAKLEAIASRSAG